MSDLKPKNTNQDGADVAIIGAGMAGLGAARALQAANRRVVLFDKGRVVGGRVCTRVGDGCRFDYGAQNIKAQGTALESVMRDQLDPRDLTTVEAPVNLHSQNEIIPGDARSNSEPKSVYRSGLATLPRELARGLNVFLGTRIERIEEDADGFTLRGANHLELMRAKRLIMTLPAPQAADLLAASVLLQDSQTRIEMLRSVQYSRCLTLCLRYEQTLDADWYALLAQDRAHPLLWLARENPKGAVLGAQTALVAQLGDAISRELWDEPEAEVARRTAGWVSEVVGAGFEVPQWFSYHRWKFSQSKAPVDFEAANPPESKLLVCGDGFSPSRVPAAYESGLQAAQRVLNDA